jgi:hypothetical protein
MRSLWQRWVGNRDLIRLLFNICIGKGGGGGGGALLRVLQAWRSQTILDPWRVDSQVLEPAPEALFGALDPGEDDGVRRYLATTLEKVFRQAVEWAQYFTTDKVAARVLMAVAAAVPETLPRPGSAAPPAALAAGAAAGAGRVCVCVLLVEKPGL